MNTRYSMVAWLKAFWVSCRTFCCISWVAAVCRASCFRGFMVCSHLGGRDSWWRRKGSHIWARPWRCRNVMKSFWSMDSSWVNRVVVSFLLSVRKSGRSASLWRWNGVLLGVFGNFFLGVLVGGSLTGMGWGRYSGEKSVHFDLS